MTMFTHSTIGTNHVFEFEAGNPIVITPAHPQYARIVTAVTTAPTDVEAIKEMVIQASKRDQVRTYTHGKVVVGDHQVSYDGAPLPDVLAAALEPAWRDDDTGKLRAWCRFIDKVETAITPVEATGLYDWLGAQRYELTANGNLIGYKYLRRESGGFLRSLHSGPNTYVNGVLQPAEEGVRQKSGDVISMPREHVVPSRGACAAAGLHIGTFDYVQTWGSRFAIFAAEINPQHIVSVPVTESGKVRVSQYTLLHEVSDHRPEHSAVDVAPVTSTAESTPLRGSSWETSADTTSPGVVKFSALALHSGMEVSAPLARWLHIVAVTVGGVPVLTVSPQTGRTQQDLALTADQVYQLAAYWDYDDIAAERLHWTESASDYISDGRRYYRRHADGQWGNFMATVLAPAGAAHPDDVAFDDVATDWHLTERGVQIIDDIYRIRSNNRDVSA